MFSQRRQWHPTPVLLPGEPHRWRSMVGCSPWGHVESDTTEWLHFHFSLSCIGEGNGSPLQCFCLENPRARGAWWTAVHGVVKTRTQLKNFTITFHFHALEKAIAAHSSVLAWRIPGTGEPGGLLSMGSHRVRHDWRDLAAAAAACVWHQCSYNLLLCEGGWLPVSSVSSFPTIAYLCLSLPKRVAQPCHWFAI